MVVKVKVIGNMGENDHVILEFKGRKNAEESGSLWDFRRVVLDTLSTRRKVSTKSEKFCKMRYQIYNLVICNLVICNL